MDAGPRILGLVTCAALLAACAGGRTGPAVEPTGVATTPPAGGASTAPPFGGPGQTGSPVGGAGSTISGTIDFKSHTDEYRTEHELKTETFNVMIVVSLVRDPSDPGERYIDSGSTYQIDGLFHGELRNEICTAITERKASNEVYAFTDQPTSYPNSIEAVVERASGSAKLEINISWPYLQTVDDCPNDSSFSFENATGLGCTGLGLDGKLVEGPTGTQIDMACAGLHGLTTVSGILGIGQ